MGAISTIVGVVGAVAKGVSTVSGMFGGRKKKQATPVNNSVVGNQSQANLSTGVVGEQSQMAQSNNSLVEQGQMQQELQANSQKNVYIDNPRKTFSKLSGASGASDPTMDNQNINN